MTEENVVEVAARVAGASTIFEMTNTDLKRRYLIRNIAAFNRIVSMIDGNIGTFGTGYPFYVLNSHLRGELPIIPEQIRYNNELIKESQKTKKTIWGCRSCLARNYTDMPDLKQICKPCPNTDTKLKPRKFINRLPDMDMWMICPDGQVNVMEKKLTRLFKKYGIHPSDYDPIKSMKEVQEIAEQLKNGEMPNMLLPIDAHIISYSTLRNLILQVPDELQYAKENGFVPYLPIHPKSFRKRWQYDDEAYNFVYDFLSAFTTFNACEELDYTVRKVRQEIAQKYTPGELFGFLHQSATDANKRRFESPELQVVFANKIKEWQKIELIQEKDEKSQEEI